MNISNDNFDKQVLKKMNKKIKINGNGIRKTIKKTIKSIKNIEDKLEDKIEDKIDMVTNVIQQSFKQTKYPIIVEKILMENSDFEIINYKIIRTPVPHLIVNALNIISLNKIKKRLDRSQYDELYHLFLEVELSNNKKIHIEKNERINMIMNPPARDNSEYRIMNVSKKITLNELMDNCKNKMGTNKYFSYNASTNNCQDFLENILTSNEIGTNEDIEFIKQDTQFLFKDKKYTEKIANTVVKLGAIGNTIFNGGTIKNNKKINKKILKVVVRNVIPAVISSATEGAVLLATESPFISSTLGRKLGDKLGDVAANKLGKITGTGLKKTNLWLEEVKNLRLKNNLTYKEALKEAAKIRKDLKN